MAHSGKGKRTQHNVYVMLGAPGTAKTTMAKYMGELMVKKRLLPGNRFISVNGAELKGEYVGHTVPKIKNLFHNNDIIFIDEAYSLVGDKGEVDCFSSEALAQLAIELEEHTENKLVILAGYGGKNVNAKNNKMQAFLDANPGIKSRIAATISFPSYSPSEATNIFFSIAKNQGYDIDENTRGIVEDYFSRRCMDQNFGNGREARGLVEASAVSLATRCFGRGNGRRFSKKEMNKITYEDVQNAIKRKTAENEVLSCGNYGSGSKKIGF